MEITNDYADYISRRIAGEKVTTMASVLASLIDAKGMTDFAILQLDENLLHFTEFEVNDGRYHVVKQHKESNNAMNQVMPKQYLTDEHTQKWWKSVFGEKNGRHTYDEFYDDFSVSDLKIEADATSSIDSDKPLTFRDFLPNIKAVVGRWSFLHGISTLYVAGSYTCSLLFYIIEQSFAGVRVVSIAPGEVVSDADINETPRVILPPTLSQYKICICGGLSLTSLAITESLRISLPINDMILKDNIISNYSLMWENVVNPDAIVADYLVVETAYKEIFLHIECDAYGNTFLISNDHLNNRIVTLLNI